MKKIAVSELAAGQRFSHPVYMDEDNLFVPEGLPIKERDIERLHKWGIHEVYSDGEPISEDPQQAFNAFFLKRLRTLHLKDKDLSPLLKWTAGVDLFEKEVRARGS